MKTPAQRLGNMVWVLIFGGLFVLGVGLSLERSGQSFGWAFIVVGTVAVVAGCVLIWVRSRMAER